METMLFCLPGVCVPLKQATLDGHQHWCMVTLLRKDERPNWTESVSGQDVGSGYESTVSGHQDVSQELRILYST